MQRAISVMKEHLNHQHPENIFGYWLLGLVTHVNLTAGSCFVFIAPNQIAAACFLRSSCFRFTAVRCHTRVRYLIEEVWGWRLGEGLLLWLWLTAGSYLHMQSYTLP